LKVFKGPSRWYQKGYEEERYHCDFILEPNEELLIEVISKNREIKLLNVKCSKGMVVKVHMDISWSEAKEVLKPYGGTT